MRLKPKSTLKINSLDKNIITELVIKKSNFVPLYIIIAIIFLLLFSRLFSLQIVNGSKYLAASNQNYKNRNIIRAPRGIIYDSNGEKLVYNVQVYSIYIDPSEFDLEADGKRLAIILGISEDEIRQKIEKENVFGRVTLKNELDHDSYLSMIKDLEVINGVYAITETGRRYIDPYMYTNIVGYIGDASESDLNDKVDAHSRVGKTGLESLFDYELRGTDGVQISEIDIADGKNKVYIPNSPQPGDSIVLNINNDWQRLAYLYLQDKVVASGGLGGAFAVMDIDTGELKVMASYPTVDVGNFTEGISTSEYQQILSDPGTPMLDRVMSMALPTGSIFKVISGSIGLQEGIIDENTTFRSNGCMDLPGNKLKVCESYNRVLGDVNIYSAISLSSNIYFCSMGLKLEEEREGIKTFKSYTDYFGIGKKTGIILPNESAGTMASPNYKYEVYKEPWYVGDICNTVVGQGLVTATPLQMLVAEAAIENGGKVLEPLLVKQIEDSNGIVTQKFETKVVTNLPIDPKNLDIIKSAMRKAVTDWNGTSRKLASIDKYVTAKTGTATSSVTINGVLYDAPHAWVLGVFEYEGHKYAYVVNIAHGGWGEGAIDVVKRFLESL